MTRTDGRVSTLGRAAMLLAPLALFAVPACAQMPRVRPLVVSFASARTGADSANLILARARADSAAFDTSSGVGDEQRLMVGTTCYPGDCTYGPRAKIQPHKATSYRTEAPPDTWVAIARIINLDTAAYKKFNLHGRDTVYWTIGRRHGRPVSIFVSTVAEGRRLYYSDLTMERHAVAVYQQAVARWIWDDHDEAAWGTCDGGTCCRSTGRELP